MPRPKPGNPVSLFPFLAVLVCAMGSLILLLLVMTRKIREDQELQQQTVVAPAVQQLPDFNPAIRILEQECEETERQLVAARNERDRIARNIAALRATQTEQKQLLTSVRGQIRDLPEAVDNPELQQESEQLLATELDLQRQLSETEAELLQKQKQLLQLNQQIAAAEIQLQERRSAILALRSQVLQEQQVTTSAVGTELEFSGSTGTTRTPLLVNVTENGFELLPGGPQISLADMKSFPVRDNPLLSAILAVHRVRSNDSLSDRPYVLLLVRPGGSLPFYAAQRTLAEADIHFGYELLLPDRQIRTGTTAVAEQIAAQQAIEGCMLRRERIYSRLYDLAGRGAPGGDDADDDDSESGTRRIEIRADGRVIESGTRRSPVLDGRFYAGGVAPPPSYQRNRARGFADSGQRPQPGNAAAAEQLAEEFAARFAQQRREALAAEAAASQRNESVSNDALPDPAADRRMSAASTFDQWLNDGPGGDAKPAAAGGHPQQSSGLPVMPRPDFLPQPRTGLPGSTNTESAVANSSATEDPAWLRFLAQSQTETAGPVGPSATSRVDSETAALARTAARSRSATAIPVGLVVFLDEQHLTVGQQPTIPLQKRSTEYATARLLQAVNAELSDLRGQTREELMPIVKFIVSPGAERWRLSLQKSLQQAGVRCVTTYQLTPYVQQADLSGYARVADQAPEVVQ